VVQVYIGYLRRKIDDRFGTPVIQTVRGHGYRVTASDDA
jgi:two-component system OmpR family response regulator